MSNNKKIKLKTLVSFFIFLSIIGTALAISIIAGFSFEEVINKDTKFILESIYTKNSLQLEKSEVKNIVNMINSIREEREKNLKKIIKERTYRGWFIADDIYTKYHGIIPDNQIKEKILDALRYQVFDKGNGYYFIDSVDGVEILSPQKELIGKNLLKDKRYAKYIKQEIEIIKKNKEGFVYGKFIRDGKLRERIAYLKEFKPFNWYIGSGRFISDFNRSTKRYILKEIRNAFLSFKNPSIFIIQIDENSKCPLKMILYSNKEINNHTCLTKIKEKITYLNSKACVADCLNKLLKNGELETELIWPFFKNRLEKERIVYLYYYKPFNWIIGSNVPKNIEVAFPELKKAMMGEIDKYTKRLFIVSIILSILIASALWILTFVKTTYGTLNEDVKTIENFFKEYKEGERVNANAIKIEEFESIATYINKLFDEIEEKNRKIDALLKRFELLAENMPNCLGIFEPNENNELVLRFANHIMKECAKIKELNKSKEIKLNEIFDSIPNLTIDAILNRNHTIVFSTKCLSPDKVVRVTLYKSDDKSVVCIGTDITESVGTFIEREKSIKRFETFLDKIRTGIIVLDKKATLRYVNSFGKKLLGVESSSTLRLEELNIPDGLKYKFLKIIHQKEICESCEINIDTADGKSKWFEVYASSFNLDKESLIIISFNDITQKYLKNKQLEYLSFHDTLTGLYNRRYFEEELRRLFNKRNYPLTLTLFDLNGLKIANDILGHEIGDKIICKMAEILSTTSRGNDIVARIGGDEFAILMPNTDEKGATTFVNRVLEKIKEHNKKEKLRISVSWGFAIQYGEFDDSEELFQEADKNMYSNKYSTNRKNELKKIIEWALSLQREKIKTLQETEIDEEYFINR